MRKLKRIINGAPAKSRSARTGTEAGMAEVLSRLWRVRDRTSRKESGQPNGRKKRTPEKTMDGFCRRAKNNKGDRWQALQVPGLWFCCVMLSFFSVGLFAEDSGKSGNQQQARIQRLEYAIRSEAAEQLIAEMRAYAKSQGGYMSSLQYGRLELRIPDTIGRAAIEQKLASVAGTHIYRNERSENDVSEELADLKARLAVAEKNLGRLRALSGAAELDDLLDLEQALSRSLNEVNQYKGQIRYLQESSQLTQVLLQINQMGGTSSATIVPIGWIRGLTLPAIVGGSK